MLIYENLRLAFFSLKANKMRALLTMLGIIIGIASVITIMTVGNSMSQSIEKEMESFGANNLSVMITQKEEESKWSTDSTKEPKEKDFVTREMLMEYCEQFSDQILSIASSENVGTRAQILNKNLYANVVVIGVSTGSFVSNGIEMLAGHIFTPQETEKESMVAIISDKAVDNMFGGETDKALGSTIEVNIDEKYYNFTIVGVYRHKQDSAMNGTSMKNITTNLYIPIVTAQKIKHTSGYNGFTVIIRPDVDADAFSNITMDFFNKFYNDNKDFKIYAFSMSSTIDSATGMVNAVSAGISVIAGIALLVGGIGVMNIMLVSVTERTKEIGIRKALGAPDRFIRIQFIMESMVICLVGGFIGVVAGIALGYFAVSIMGSMMGMEMTATISTQSIVISLSFSMAIGLFFGYYPANKASKLDPIEALQYE